MLDVLVEAESPHNQWPLWESEEQFSAVGHA